MDVTAHRKRVQVRKYYYTTLLLNSRDLLLFKGIAARDGIKEILNDLPGHDLIGKKTSHATVPLMDWGIEAAGLSCTDPVNWKFSFVRAELLARGIVLVEV